MSWTEVPIGEVVSPQQGMAFNKKNNHLMVEDGVPLLRITDLINGTESKFVDRERVPKRFISKLSDIIYTRTGQVGLVFKGRVGVIHNNCFRVIPISCVDPEYLYQYLRQPSFRRHALQLASGAAQPDLNHDAFKSIPIKYPSLPTQKRIAAILSAYDDLIENNTRRIAILEEMARRLYEDWFVHFRFPAHEETEFDEELPKGWATKELQDVARLVMGQSPKSEFYNQSGDGLPFHQGVSDFGPFFPTDRLFCNVEGRIAEEGDILVSVRAPVGRINIATKKMVIGRGLCAIRSSTGHQNFLLSQLRDRFAEEDSMGSGAIFNAVTKKDMQTLDLVAPPVRIMDRFEKAANPLWCSIRNLSDKNANLRVQRDLLLPKLVSGEIDVSGAEEALEAAA